MRHAIRQQGHAYTIRPVTTEDAGFIAALRTAPDNARFIGATSPDPADQARWIEAYFERPGDYYFIVERTGSHRREGTVSIYDHDETTGAAEWGRWVLTAGSSAAVESVLLTYRVAFEVLGLRRVYARTLMENERVVSFHDQSGATCTGRPAGQMVVAGQPRDYVQHELTRETWPAVRDRLDTIAARLGQRLAGGERA